MPPASTAIVPCLSVLRCAAVSIPRSSPEDMTKPPSLSSLASWRVNFFRRGAVAGADDGDDGKAGEFGAALDVEQGRRRIDMGERRRIARLAKCDDCCRRG